MDIEQIYKLRSIYDINEYLEYLSKLEDDCMILVSVKDSPGLNMQADVLEKIHNVGFKGFRTDLWWMYAAVKYRDQVKEISASIAEEPVEIKGDLGNISIEIKSNAWRRGNDSVISINNIDYSQKNRGVNIVVYDIVSNNVIDSIAYDAHNMDMKFFNRNYLMFKHQMYENARPRFTLPRKINIRFFLWAGYQFINVVKTIFISLLKNKNVDLKVIYDTEEDKNIELLEKIGVRNLKYYHNYNIEKDDIDIIVFTGANDILRYTTNELKKFRKHCKLFVFLPVCTILNAYDNYTNIKNWALDRLERVGIDYVILDKLMYNNYRYMDLMRNYMVNIGNPKFDTIYEKLNAVKEYPEKWKKIQDKKKILWLVDHDWWQGTNVSFDLYAKSILKKMNSSEKISLIIRPHPCFERDTIASGILSEEDFRKYHEYVDNSLNIIWDDLPDYSVSYQLADYIFLERGSGVILSALLTGKPICVLYRNDCLLNDNNKDLLNNYYSVYNEDDLDVIFQMIENNDDPMKEKRLEAIDKYISHFDGKNGERIAEFLLKEYHKK